MESLVKPTFPGIGVLLGDTIRVYWPPPGWDGSSARAMRPITLTPEVARYAERQARKNRMATKRVEKKDR